MKILIIILLIHYCMPHKVYIQKKEEDEEQRNPECGQEVYEL